MIGVYVVAISNFSALDNGVLIIITPSLQSSGHTIICLSLAASNMDNIKSILHKNFGQP